MYAGEQSRHFLNGPNGIGGQIPRSISAAKHTASPGFAIYANPMRLIHCYCFCYLTKHQLGITVNSRPYSARDAVSVNLSSHLNKVRPFPSLNTASAVLYPQGVDVRYVRSAEACNRSQFVPSGRSPKFALPVSQPRTKRQSSMVLYEHPLTVHTFTHSVFSRDVARGRRDTQQWYSGQEKESQTMQTCIGIAFAQLPSRISRLI